MLNSNTKRKINNARDILVGKIPMPTTQVEQITLALIYKFMADMDKRSKALGDTSGFFANGYEKYSWDTLMDKAIPARDRVKLYGEGLEKMSTNPHIPQLFRNIFKNAFLPFNDPEVLKLFLDQIDQFDYEHSEELGNAFEYLLSSMSSQGDAGQFRTPRHIIDFIVKVVDPKKTDRILDPACGTAGFLISAYKHLVANGLKNDELKNISKNFVGYDISHDMVRLSLVNLYLHHFPDPHVYEYDTLTNEDRWDDDFDVILANPPFMTPKGGMKTHSKFSISSKKAEVLFTDYIMEHLSINGKAGVIVPEGIIFQSQNAYKNLRKMMIEDGYLWAVVSLPSGVFNPYSGVKTSILLFDKKLAKKTNKILFVKVENDGYGLGAQRRQIKNDDLPQALEVLQNYKQAINDGNEFEVEDNNIAHLVEKVKIKESGDWNLSGERYKSSKQIKNGSFEIVKLSNSDLFKIESGGTPSTKKKEYWNGSINWATLVDLPQENIVSDVAGTARTITKEGLKSSSAKLIPSDSVLVSTRATIGRIAINKTPIATNQGFKNIVIKDKTKVLPKFLAYVLTAKVDDMKKMASGGTFKELSKTNFSTLEIPLPPLAVQKEIVEELDRYQKIIDGAKQIIDNYKPYFEIEENWDWVEIVKICDNLDSKRVPIEKGKRKPGDIPYYGASGIVDHVDDYIFDEKLLLISEDGANLLARSTPIAFSISGKTWVNNHAHVLRFKDKVQQKLVEIFLNQSDISNYVTGSAQPKLNQKNLNKIKIPFPPIENQKRIVFQIQEEHNIIRANIDLSKKFEEKIKNKIDKIWDK